MSKKYSRAVIRGDLSVNYLILCDYASVSSDNKINVVGIFENIQTTQVPVNHPQFFAVASIRIINKGKYDFSLVVEDDQGIEVSEKKKFSFNSSAEKNKDSVVLSVQFLSLKFNKFGEYRVVLAVEDSVLATSRLQINKV